STPSFKAHLAKFQYGSPSPSTNPSSPTSARLSRTMKRSISSTDITTTSTTTPTRNPRPSKKKRKPSSKYAPPSLYSHLTPLTDILAPDLICICVGTNPGVQTATAGHAYAHPSNHFWKLLHASGMTPDRRLRPEEDRTLPARYGIGNTNIVDRPSRDAGELSREEMVEGAGVLDEKVGVWRPEAVLIVGKGIWEAVWRWRVGRGMRRGEFRYGWQDVRFNMGRGKVEGGGEEEVGGDGKGWDGARVYVTTSTSGLAANLKPAEKEAIWKPFGDWVQQRRADRGFKPR
ncbi:DNA glycosylase, partial [Aaosphaeria arxii CBS 175.79]